MKSITATKDNGTTHRLINSNFFDVNLIDTNLTNYPDLVLTDLPYHYSS